MITREFGGTAMTRREMLALLGGGALVSLHGGCTGNDGGSTYTEPDGSIHYASLVDVARLIERGDASPVALTERMLARIQAIDGRLKSYATVMDERALDQARVAQQEIEAGNYRGPLHGIPIAVKDLCYTRGVRTMGGTAALADFIPDFDATVVAKLQDAGAVLLGKLNLTEGAMGGYNPEFDLPVNPWDESLWVGASSSGSGVATAAGLCFGSLGSDTGGSIRFPSMANGIVGLKPTYGRVSRYGVLALAESLDHIGPMTRSVADAAVMLEAIAGRDPNDPTSLPDPVPDILGELERGVQGARIGFDRAYATAGVDPGIVAALDEALTVLESLGAQIVEVSLPAFSQEVGDAWFAICSREAAHAHAQTYPARAADYGPYFTDFLEMGLAVTDEVYAGATALRDAYSEQFRAALGTADAVACPAGGVPFPFPAEAQFGDMAGFDPYLENVWFQFTLPADFAGTPSISLPCGV
ncbi:MAG: amidase, partial [Gemmatimonadota bacterium]|nr:amidase [Gemmatimonadota bacterium]